MIPSRRRLLQREEVIALGTCQRILDSQNDIGCGINARMNLTQEKLRSAEKCERRTQLDRQKSEGSPVCLMNEGPCTLRTTVAELPAKGDSEGAQDPLKLLTLRIRNLNEGKQALMLKVLDKLEADDGPRVTEADLSYFFPPKLSRAMGGTEESSPVSGVAGGSLLRSRGLSDLFDQPNGGGVSELISFGGRCDDLLQSRKTCSSTHACNLHKPPQIPDPSLPLAGGCDIPFSVSDLSVRMTPYTRRGSLPYMSSCLVTTPPCLGSKSEPPPTPGATMPSGLELSPLQPSLLQRERTGSLPPLDLPGPNSAHGTPTEASIVSPATSRMLLFKGVERNSANDGPFARGRAGSLPPLLPDSPRNFPLAHPLGGTSSSARHLPRTPAESEPVERRRHSLFPESSVMPRPTPAIWCKGDPSPLQSSISFNPKQRSAAYSGGRKQGGRSITSPNQETPTPRPDPLQFESFTSSKQSPNVSSKAAEFDCQGECATSSTKSKNSPAQHQAPFIPSPPKRARGAFRIPHTPHGRYLIINILSTWGDPHFVGLTGLEVFDKEGHCVSDLAANPMFQVGADPHSINALPEYGLDPRTADKLVDGVYCTSDDRHMWLAPFSENRAHYVHIDLGRPMALAMLRFWNYNKSVIHSFRGARYVEVHLDGTPIYKGELQKAPGNAEAGNYAHCILFTLSEETIATIKAFDRMKEAAEIEDPLLRLRHFGLRPRTASRQSTHPAVQTGRTPPKAALGLLVEDPNESRAVVSPCLTISNCSDVVLGDRPSTAALSGCRPSSRLGEGCVTTATMSPLTSEHVLPKGRTVTITILNNWGDPCFVGLTSLQILDQFQQPYEVTEAMVSAFPSDITALPGHHDDPRVLKNLIDDCNVTTNSACMWVTPLSLCKSPQITVTFPKEVKVSGFRFWNYNSSVGDSFTGIKRIQVSVDKQRVSPSEGFVVPKAPGHADFDFCHTVLLCTPIPPQTVLSTSLMCTSVRTEAGNSGVPSLLIPMGYVFKVEILSNHGDSRYVGLTGIALFDVINDEVALMGDNLRSVPSGIATQEEPSCGPHSLSNLVDGVNEGATDGHMWLAPYTPGKPAVVYVVLEEPIAISVIKFWNYSKVPAQGAKDIMVWADDTLIYRGALAPSDIHPSQALFFTDDPLVIEEHGLELKSSFYQMPTSTPFTCRQRPVSPGQNGGFLLPVTQGRLR